VSISYHYGTPAGEATLLQVVYDNGTDTIMVELDAVFTEGEYDAVATEALVAAGVANLNFPAENQYNQ
tara:strand:+ start:1394 stop:1597 length:204 start_codon:yes stop_codon:yes gene_type:complete